MNWKLFWRLNAHVQLAPVLESGEETLIGGQAVMEGVMMRAPHSYCVAVRKSNGEIVEETAPLGKLSDKYPIFKLPIVRGVGTLASAMKLGMKALKFSADVQLAEEEAKKQATTADGAPVKKGPTEMPGWAMAGQLAFSLVFFIVLYKFIPLLLTEQLQTVYPVIENRILFNLVDGVIRIAIFLAFLYGISRTADIRRVFQYHGAEHKVVFNYESGKPVDVATAQSFVTFHPRCGTSFLIVVMLISMVLYMFLPVDGFWPKLLSRVVLIPFVAGLSYELIRYAAKNKGSLLTLLAAPGLWLQRITTQPPDDQQTEIAIHALNGAMRLEKEQGGELVVA
jgi:uncharacterized protein YqhQ